MNAHGTKAQGAVDAKRHKSTTHEERFYHIREEFDYNGKRMKGATVFFRKENGRWYYAVARCSSNDNWNKAMGRTIARRHYFQIRPEVTNLLPQGMEPAYESAKAIAYKR
jgi:site-specific DNA-adenine methylase